MRSSLALLTTIALLLSQEAAYAQMGLLASVSSGHYVYDSNLTIYVDLEDSIYPASENWTCSRHKILPFRHDIRGGRSARARRDGF